MMGRVYLLQVEECIDSTGIAFMYAPTMLSAMKVSEGKGNYYYYCCYHYNKYYSHDDHCCCCRFAIDLTPLLPSLHLPLFLLLLPLLLFQVVAPVRKSLGVRTVFNIVGPLLNPARAQHVVIGVFHEVRVVVGGGGGKG